MGKRQAKKSAGWSVFGKGLIVSGVVYLMEILLFALLLVKGIAVIENAGVLLAVGGAISAFAGNPYVIDLDALYGEGLLTYEELEREKQSSPYLCDFNALAKRFDLFLAASKRVKEREAVDAFIENNPRLDEFCHFMALKDANGGCPWWEFDAEKSEDADVLFMHRFLQYKFFEQWSEVKAYANAKGVKIIGDMPIYVDLDSSDVYFGRKNFLLDADGKPSLVAGVPPDYFSPDGQLWGNPIYDWSYMKNEGYTWWRDRMAHTMKVFDGVRIDHFRAFADYYTVKATDKNAKNGKWNKGPGLPFVKILKEVAGGGMETIVKQKGSAGTADPLDQRSSVGYTLAVVA